MDLNRSMDSHLSLKCMFYRSLQIASDLDSLAKASNITNRSFEVNPTQQAVACCEYIARLGAIAGEEQEEEHRQEAVLRSAMITQPPALPCSPHPFLR